MGTGLESTNGVSESDRLDDIFARADALAKEIRETPDSPRKQSLIAAITAIQMIGKQLREYSARLETPGLPPQTTADRGRRRGLGRRWGARNRSE